MKLGHNFFLTLLTGVVIVLFLVITFENRGLLDVYRLKQEMARLEKENNRLQKEITELRRTADRLMHDAKYLESVAREELGMVGQDEIIYRFVEKSQSGVEK